MAEISLATASELFDTNVRLKFQNHRVLQDTIQERHGTTGDATNIPVSDIIEMQVSSFAPTNIPVTPVVETNITVTPRDYKVKTVIGGGEKTLFAYDKIVDQARLHGLAAARLDDYIKISAITGSASYGSLYTIPVTTGVSTGMNADKLAAAIDYIAAQGADTNNYALSCWLPASLKASFVGDQKVSNFFYNDVKPYTNYSIKAFEGVDIRILGQNGVNSLPTTAPGGGITQWLVPVVHQDAVVQIYNRDIQTSITWVAQEDRWELVTVVTTGGSIIQTDGIVLITAQNPYSANP